MRSVIRRAPLLPAALLLAACGGGGGGVSAPVFAVSGTSPPDGAVGASRNTPVVITFNVPADLATVTPATLWMQGGGGVPVGTQLLKEPANPTNVRLRPLASLVENGQYRVFVSGTIRSAAGRALGADHSICFITASSTPTVRPDQVVDLGDRLRVPRFLARGVRLPDGRFAVFGGFRDPTEVTDTIEVWDPVRATFDLLSVRMRSPRAEHTVTVLDGGRVLVAGGVDRAGGDPLRSTELFHWATGTVSVGPDLNEGRRWHGASAFQGGTSAIVAGGFGVAGGALDTTEYLDGSLWRYVAHPLPEPTAQHVQVLFGFDQVYVGASNVRAQSAVFTGFSLLALQEGDQRYRAVFQRLGSNRILIVGGDTRSMTTYDAGSNADWLASDLLHERRGAHSVTVRGDSGTRFLVAGGFNIARQGEPPLSSLEIVDFLPQGPFGFPDAAAYEVFNVELPLPFAGHVGFNQSDGATVLAGGVGDGIGPHSRRVVLVHDSRTKPSAGCSGP